MFRLVVLFISIVWASLMLISWSGATPTLEKSVSEVPTLTRS